MLLRARRHQLPKTLSSAGSPFSWALAKPGPPPGTSAIPGSANSGSGRSISCEGNCLGSLVNPMPNTTASPTKASTGMRNNSRFMARYSAGTSAAPIGRTTGAPMR